MSDERRRARNWPTTGDTQFLASPGAWAQTPICFDPAARMIEKRKLRQRPTRIGRKPRWRGGVAFLAAVAAIVSAALTVVDHVHGGPEGDRPRIAVHVTPGWDLTVLHKTSAQGKCAPQHYVDVAVDNVGLRRLVLTDLTLVTPPRQGRRDVETTLDLNRSRKVVGSGSYNGPVLPHALGAGEHATFHYVATGSATVRRADFIRVTTNLTSPVEVEIPFSTFEPVRCNQFH